MIKPSDLSFKIKVTHFVLLLIQKYNIDVSHIVLVTT